MRCERCESQSAAYHALNVQMEHGNELVHLWLCDSCYRIGEAQEPILSATTFLSHSELFNEICQEVQDDGFDARDDKGLAVALVIMASNYDLTEVQQGESLSRAEIKARVQTARSAFDSWQPWQAGIDEQ